MHIRAITLVPVRIRLKKPFVISLGPLTHAENVFVKLEDEEGTCGWGECSPFRTIHGETIETCMAVGKELCAVILRDNPKSPLELLDCMDRLFYGNTSIKSAFDSACHDLLARKAGIPLFRFLGGQTIRTIHTDYTVSIGDPDQMAKDAEEIVQAGFPVIKVKLGGRPKEDILRMHAIRKKIGNIIPVRIDANQGWTPEGAVEVLDALKELRIQHCEEPIPRHHFDKLPMVRSSTSIPLMADESCFTEHDAERLIAIEACDGINIKLGKSSGLVRAQRIAEAGKKKGMVLQAGGFLESRLGFTATAHLVQADASIVHIDFDTPLMFEDDPVEGGITYGSGGRIDMPASAGSGASLKDGFAEGGITITG